MTSLTTTAMSLTGQHFSLHAHHPVFRIRQMKRLIPVVTWGGVHRWSPATHSMVIIVDEIMKLSAEAHLEALLHACHDVVEEKAPALAHLGDELLAQLHLPRVQHALAEGDEVLGVVAVEGGMLGAQQQQRLVDFVGILQVVHQRGQHAHELGGVLPKGRECVQVLHALDAGTGCIVY